MELLYQNLMVFLSREEHPSITFRSSPFRIFLEPNTLLTYSVGSG